MTTGLIAVSENIRHITVNSEILQNPSKNEYRIYILWL